MSFKKLLESKTGAFIFGISILIVCFACIIIKIFCVWGLHDFRQRSKIVPVKKEEDDIIRLTVNPYNFVKVTETSLHSISKSLNKKEIAYIEI